MYIVQSTYIQYSTMHIMYNVHKNWCVRITSKGLQIYKNKQTKSKQKSSYSNGPEVLVCFLFREKDRNLIHLEKFALLLFFLGGGGE